MELIAIKRDRVLYGVTLSPPLGTLKHHRSNFHGSPDKTESMEAATY
jgi:hypothetical protein